MVNELLDLINDYVSCSTYMCGSLKDFYDVEGDTSLTSQNRSNAIPEQGNLPDGIHFTFHGNGCYFEFENGGIDVDFGPNNRCDGFDLYRLREYWLMSKKSVYKNLTEEAFMQGKFDEIVKKGFICNPNWNPGKELFYLSELVN
ncbi:DUF6896 domain-containing protein [Mucilaginibacter agri]|uniref:DUF6896 domain-containing protein n=1 Tax=Mucilaginibacter agri TaxID=2695265 RepID=A0A965ZEZ5_9SPHI|nr:hypothetical protein [Mucilaginibacter agri]NCD68451.1 hypothetical protein [Mucilaginibacter agri]